LPQFAAATVDSVELGGDLVTFRVRAKAGDAACSGCRRRSSRVHARYQRQLADLPLGGRRVRVIAHIRRFKCVSPRCPQSTFSEQIPGLTTPFARRTPPLTGALAKVALALAGRPGSRLAAELAMPSCRDVLIRLIRAQPIPGAGLIEILGVDLSGVPGGPSATSANVPWVGVLARRRVVIRGPTTTSGTLQWCLSSLRCLL
jgi:transposase